MKEKKIELMAGQAWSHWEAKPFEDPDYKEESPAELAHDLEALAGI